MAFLEFPESFETCCNRNEIFIIFYIVPRPGSIGIEPIPALATNIGDTFLYEKGKESRGGGRGQGARRSIAGIGREKNPKASLRQEASRRPTE
jgi:hypothetical protein